MRSFSTMPTLNRSSRQYASKVLTGNHVIPCELRRLLRFLLLSVMCVNSSGWVSPTRSSSSSSSSRATSSNVSTKAKGTAATELSSPPTVSEYFEDFVDFLQERQTSIIAELEDFEKMSSKTFSRDGWGAFEETSSSSTPSRTTSSGGITRVIQGGDIIEKGACSLTVIRQGILSADRAETIRARQKEGVPIKAGDRYEAAALSMVLHTKSPWVPTFRSDIRIFVVHSQSADNVDADESSVSSMAWLGGGADLTPYYLFEDDITSFHQHYNELAQEFLKDNTEFSYESMKQACDEYFYLPARSEHRGTGGIFFDDMEVSNETMNFCKGVANTWMPSWLPIVANRYQDPYSDQQKQWQLLRRGRYLEFNLLYDRGVKFGLASANPRVEGVMVSAPPVIAYEYKHVVEPESPEATMMKVLKEPRSWV